MSKRREFLKFFSGLLCNYYASLRFSLGRGGEFLVTEALAHKRETLNSLGSTHVKSQAQWHIVCDPGDGEVEIDDP